MKKQQWKFLISIIFTIIFISQTVLAASNNNFTLTKEQKLEDINYLYQTLKEGQPHFNEPLFLKEIKKVKQNIVNLDDIAFGYELARVLACAKDAHTKIYLDEQSTQPILPIWSIEQYENGWYIKGISSEYKQYLGKELISINRHSISEILEKMTPYFSSENEIKIEDSLLEAVQIPEFLKYIGVIKNTDEIPIQIRNSNGIKTTVTIKTVQSDNETAFQNGAWLPNSKTEQSQEKYRFIPLDSTTLFIQCNQCYEEEQNPLKEFEKELEKELKTGKYKKVIFDLRYNPGGNYPSFERLTAIPSELKEQYAYKLYALIGTKTFSSGVIQAVQLKNAGATLVGTPTGGNVNFYANTKNFELPNSHIKGFYSTAYQDIWTEYKGAYLIPDITVKQTIEDALKGIDTIIQTIMQESI